MEASKGVVGKKFVFVEVNVNKKRGNVELTSKL